MKRGILTLIVVALTISAIACGPVPLAQYGVRRFYREARGIRFDAFAAEPLKHDLHAYRRLVVEPLENQMEDEIPSELVASLNDQLFQHLKRVKHLEVVRYDSYRDGTHHEAQVIGISQTGAGSVGPFPTSAQRLQQFRPYGSNTVVILHATIVDFDAGKKSMRILQMGVGRQAVLTLHVWLRDGASGHVLGKYVVNSEVYRLPSDSHAAIAQVSKGVGTLVAELVEEPARPQHPTPGGH